MRSDVVAPLLTTSEVFWLKLAVSCLLEYSVASSLLASAATPVIQMQLAVVSLCASEMTRALSSLAMLSLALVAVLGVISLTATC